MTDYIWLVLGVVAGFVAIAVGGRSLAGQSGKSVKPTPLGWCVLVFGLVSLGLALIVTSGVGALAWALAAGTATLIAGVGALVKGDRHWPTWTGLAIGVIPALLWALFALGYLLDPNL